MYGSRLNLARAVWSDHSLDMNTASTRFFSLCGQDGWLQYRAAFYMSVIIYVDVQNIDGEFLSHGEGERYCYQILSVASQGEK